MSYSFDSRLGRQLYHMLPEVYRNRDGETSQANDLAQYLDAHGYLLDQIHATLQQMLSDMLPESSQDWLLPYFAQLLAVNMLAPDSEGRHAEVKHAISWRQRKGTLKCVEEIAEAVGEMEVELQEGWQRVAMTSRINMPLMPLSVLDDTLEIDMSVPTQAARHPALPAATVDFRRASRAVEALASNPAARLSSFAGIKQYWRRTNVHALPCFPDSFDDVSRRTVDIRSADSIHGRYHHKRLLAFAPMPIGLFSFDAIRLDWSQRNDSLYEHLIEETLVDGVYLIRNKTNRTIEIQDNVDLPEDRIYRIEGLNFNKNLQVSGGGSLQLLQVQVEEVQVDTVSPLEPVVSAVNCVFNTLLAKEGVIELHACTVLNKVEVYAMQVKNSILIHIEGSDVNGVIEYSRIPDDAPFGETMLVEDCTSDEPVFFPNQTTLAARGVLAPNTPASIYAGASDGGEMGYFYAGRINKPVRISGQYTGSDAIHLSVESGRLNVLTDLVFSGDVDVDTAALVMQRCAVKSLTVQTVLAVSDDAKVIPSLSADSCLFDTLVVNNGLARLEYCTVMMDCDCNHIQASDCLFSGSLIGVTDPTVFDAEQQLFNCVRFCRIPPGITKPVAQSLRLMDTDDNFRLGSNTMETAVYNKYDYCKNGGFEHRYAKYGESGYGVIGTLSPVAIRFGAEDEGEIGAYHNRYYSLKSEAILEKMREFLPVGITPVLIHDARLMRDPPEQQPVNGDVT